MRRFEVQHQSDDHQVREIDRIAELADPATALVGESECRLREDEPEQQLLPPRQRFSNSATKLRPGCCQVPAYNSGVAVALALKTNSVSIANSVTRM